MKTHLDSCQNPILEVGAVCIYWLRCWFGHRSSFWRLLISESEVLKYRRYRLLPSTSDIAVSPISEHLQYWRTSDIGVLYTGRCLSSGHRSYSNIGDPNMVYHSTKTPKLESYRHTVIVVPDILVTLIWPRGPDIVPDVFLKTWTDGSWISCSS